MTAAPTDREYDALRRLRSRFREAGEERQAAFCERILRGLDRAAD